MFDLKKISLSKTLLWSIIVHLLAGLALYLYPGRSLRLNLNRPFHQVKLVKLKKGRRVRRKKRVRKKKIVKPKPQRRSKPKKRAKPIPPKPAASPPPEEKKPPEKPPKEEEKPEKEVLVETSHFQFNYYLDIIKNKILVDWNPDAKFLEPGMEMELKASFLIQKNGDITDLILIKGSFDDSLNQSALEAVLSAKPMPPLPEVYDEDYLTVIFTFFLRGTSE